ncbi:MAG TPA: flagellar biosynthesis anti-sigma factor FlgM [Clostridiales bacterium]|nr:flagellar biosynthesis anti-sigma factor FlgM [Clostridiales bacterium]
MRIDAFNKVSELYKANKIKTTSNVKGNCVTDKLEISQIAKDYQIAKKALKSVSDVREDLVKDIKQRMATGTYDVSANEVADRLVDKYFDELA